MGYFSQRKKHARQNLFMLISLLILSIIYIFLLFDTTNNTVFKFLRDWQFHFYLYNIFLVLYTIIHKRCSYALVAIFLMFLNYGSLAKSARLFFNQEQNGKNQIEISYHKGEQNYKIVSKQEHIEKQGKIDLSPNLGAFFVSFKEQDFLFTIINLDFSKKYASEYKMAFRNLARFVSMQNGPVIIVGDFGIPSWNPIFRKFLNQTDLSVKNRILFTDGKASFRFWFVPSINILGFDNIGIKNISMQGKQFDIDLVY